MAIKNAGFSNLSDKLLKPSLAAGPALSTPETTTSFLENLTPLSVRPQDTFDDSMLDKPALSLPELEIDEEVSGQKTGMTTRQAAALAVGADALSGGLSLLSGTKNIQEQERQALENIGRGEQDAREALDYEFNRGRKMSRIELQNKQIHQEIDYLDTLLAQLDFFDRLESEVGVGDTQQQMVVQSPLTRRVIRR